MRTLKPRLAVVSTARAAAPTKKADPFYTTAAWRTLMAKLIRTRGRQCEKCGRIDCRLFGDHVIELQDGGAELDPRNVMLLCGSCHTTKTAAARAARHTRVGGVAHSTAG
jgi:5-methylcytosine-specific restriction enzyme A